MLSRSHVFRITRNPLKYSLHENEITEVEGKIVRYGQGSFYEVEENLMNWFTFLRNTRKSRVMKKMIKKKARNIASTLSNKEFGKSHFKVARIF